MKSIVVMKVTFYSILFCKENYTEISKNESYASIPFQMEYSHELWNAACSELDENNRLCVHYRRMSMGSV
jgi:hypothetical protein